MLVFISADDAVTVQSSVWTIAPDGTLAASLPNHIVVFNSTTGVVNDLVIINVTLEDDNTVYNCADPIAIISSSVVLNVTGNNMHTHVNIQTYICIFTYVCSIVKI